MMNKVTARDVYYRNQEKAESAPGVGSADIRDGLIDMLPDLKRMALAYCKNEPDADDLVQTSVERALRHAGQWSGTSELRFWVFRILRNAWLDTGRKSSRVRLTELDPAHAVVPQESADKAVELDQIGQLFLSLPEPQREVLLLVTVEGFSYKEAAEMLEIPIGTVMSRLARARALLIEKMGETQ